MSLIYAILGALLGLHLGFRTVYIVMVSTSGYYSNRTRLIIGLSGFIAIFVLTTWITINELPVMFGI